ncbi:MAG: fumarate hydratase [Coriobacteriales bacterium]|jgi:tartrate/fumarate subfamily iron-sulfur-dependent hydro-lyase alpha chain|nr:fumarate hydratase [Coriobacteriales bacterium]
MESMDVTGKNLKLGKNPMLGENRGAGETLSPALIARLVEDAIPRLACELRPDVRAALERALKSETSERGKMVLGQLVENARIAAEQKLPLCQDTGSVWVALEVGEYDAQGNEIAISSNIFSLVNRAVAKAYAEAGLRMSLVRDALIDRSNTGDNTPAFCELFINPAKRGAVLHIMLKGGGSDNASRVVMLAPGEGTDGVLRAVLGAVLEKGASACPPLIIGVGVGSTFDKVGGLAKRALLRTLDTANPTPELAALERRLLANINALGIGPGGFGGDVTALAVHVLTAPCHIAALPLAINIGCNSLRSLSIDLSDRRLMTDKVLAQAVSPSKVVPAGASGEGTR